MTEGKSPCSAPSNYWDLERALFCSGSVAIAGDADSRTQVAPMPPYGWVANA